MLDAIDICEDPDCYGFGRPIESAFHNPPDSASGVHARVWDVLNKGTKTAYIAWALAEAIAEADEVINDLQRLKDMLAKETP